MAAETGFMIDGTLYEVPSIGTFTMDEAQTLFDYSGLALEDFAPIDEADPDKDDKETDRARRFKNPALLRALLHVAYQRGNPKLPDRRVREVVGSLNLIDALKHLSDEEDDASPPASTTEPDASSPRSSVGSSESSGTGSSSGSDARDDQPAPTTPMRLGTSSTSPPISSVA